LVFCFLFLNSSICSGKPQEGVQNGLDVRI
jgi:hypothetical protein